MKNLLDSTLIDLENILSTMPNLVFVKDKQSVFLWVNQALADLAGFKSPAELVGKSDADMPWKSGESLFQKEDQEVFMSGQSKRCYEEVIISHTGQAVKILTDKTPLKNSRGEVVAVLGVATIINNYILQEQVFFSHLLNQLPYFIFWKNTQSYYLGCNKNFANLVNIDNLKDIIGKSDYDLPWGKGEAEFFRKVDQEVMHGNPIINVEEKLLNSDGSHTVMLVSKVPVHDQSGNLIGTLGISTDITDRKKNEELEKEKAIAEKNAEAMQILAGCVAHELRTPLSVININLDLLQQQRRKLAFKDQEATAASFDKYLSATKAALKETAQVIDMLLVKIKSVASNKLDNTVFSKCSIQHTINDALETYPLKASEKNLIMRNYIKEPDFEYFGNHTLTRHVFYNLLKNALWALKEVDEGNITISLLKSKKFNQVIFRDTGPGIAAEFMPAIFDKFTSSNDIMSGSGLGLIFCRIVMKSYDGDIICHSEEGKYTEFVLSFPVTS